jgi:hypothetical protein
VKSKLQGTLLAKTSSFSCQQRLSHNLHFQNADDTLSCVNLATSILKTDVPAFTQWILRWDWF